MGQRGDVESALDQSRAGQRLDLGGEHEPVPVGRVHERLDPQAVPGDEQPPALSIPDREGPHPVEVLEHLRPPERVGVEEHLGVARTETSAPRPAVPGGVRRR